MRSGLHRRLGTKPVHLSCALGILGLLLGAFAIQGHGQVGEARQPGDRPAWIKSVARSSEQGYTRVSITLDGPAKYSSKRLSNPDRVFFDLSNTVVPRELHNKAIKVGDALLEQIRIAQNRPGATRVVLDLPASNDVTVVELENPFRVVIEVRPPAKTAAQATESPRESDRHASRQPPFSGGARAGNSAAASPPPMVAPDADVGNGSIPSVNLPEVPIRSEAPRILPRVSAPTRNGDRTLTRMLGLKISRIVIDPGHGGDDTGTVGPGGLLEKDLVLNLAKDLKQLLEGNLGAEALLTRSDDTYISLEERSAIANRSEADLFLSIHANYSQSRQTSGVETYFLDFARTASEREVAARENASTDLTVSDLQNLVLKIANADKLVESRELADVMQESLFGGARQLFPSTRNRGVRSAPFVVLIDTKMPSVLVEVAFISNPRDEKLLRKDSNRLRLAEALFYGIEGYMKTLGTEVAQVQSNPDN